MNLEVDFHNSELSEVKVSPNELEFCFSEVTIVLTHPARGVIDGKEYKTTAVIKIAGPKYKTLPKKGKITEGELYGIPGKPLSGRLPVDFKFDRSCELVLEDIKNEYSIQAKGIQLIVNLAKLPASLKDS